LVLLVIVVVVWLEFRFWVGVACCYCCSLVRISVLAWFCLLSPFVLVRIPGLGWFCLLLLLLFG